MLDVILQLLDECIAGLVLPFLAEDHRGFHHHATCLVGHAGDGAFHYGRMCHQGTLHLEGTDTIARALDDVVGTTFEPVVAVLVAPSHVAREVVAVVAGFEGDVAVAIVFLEESDGFVSLVQADGNLALLAILAEREVGAQQGNLVLCVGFAHAAGLWLHPRESAQRHGGLGLPEAFHEADARQLEELLVDGRIECLASRGAVAEGREVVAAEVFADEETIDCGRRTEARDVVLLHLPQYLLRRKLLVVEDEDAGSGKPLAVELAPNGLAPSRVGYGEMDAVGREVVPENTGREMADSVEEVVCHHLRLARRARGEVENHGVAVGIHEARATECGSFPDFCMPVVEPFRHVGTNRDEQVYRRTLGHGLLHFAQNVRLAHADDGLHGGCIVAIDDVMAGEHVRSRNRHGPEFVQGKHRNPPFQSALLDEHHHVAAPDVKGMQVRCSLVALALEVGKGESALSALVVRPE